MLTYTIVVNDNGELKTISQAEIDKLHPATDHALECAVGIILDQRSANEDAVSLVVKEDFKRTPNDGYGNPANGEYNAFLGDDGSDIPCD